MAKKTPQRNEKGQFVKGCKKEGGRKAGTPNKYGNVRDRLKELILPYLETDPDKQGPSERKTLAKDLQAINDPKDRADIIAKFMPYIVPRYTATTISADADRPVNEEEMLIDLDRKFTKKETTITLRQVTIVDNDNPASTPSAIPLTDYDPDEDDDFDPSTLEQ